MIPLNLVFSALTIFSAALAIFFSDSRKVIASAWVAGMSLGAVFLAYGAEFLAVVQWVVTTLSAISLLVFATMYGEYGAEDPRTARARVFDALPALVIGGAFSAMIFLAVHAIPETASTLVGPSPALDLVGMGHALGEHHLVALELLGFMLLAVVVGAGVVSRAEKDSE